MTGALIFTVYRRYHELARNLPRARELARAEWGYDPEVILVWADPETGRSWFVRDLVDRGLVQHVLRRPPMPSEGSPATTHCESQNIRLGLEFVSSLTCPHCRRPHADFVVLLSADIHVADGTLALIQNQMREGARVVAFHWANSIAHADVWHTNFFGVCLDASYWPPVSPPSEQDVLERQWGKLLANKVGVFPQHNAGDRKFSHQHLSESLPEIEHRPEPLSASLNVVVWNEPLKKGTDWGWGAWLWSWLSSWYEWLGQPVWAAAPKTPPKDEQEA